MSNFQCGRVDLKSIEGKALWVLTTWRSFALVPLFIGRKIKLGHIDEGLHKEISYAAQDPGFA
jgi:hypothetical protein